MSAAREGTPPVSAAEVAVDAGAVVMGVVAEVGTEVAPSFGADTATGGGAPFCCEATTVCGCCGVCCDAPAALAEDDEDDEDEEELPLTPPMAALATLFACEKREAKPRLTMLLLLAGAGAGAAPDAEAEAAGDDSLIGDKADAGLPRGEELAEAVLPAVMLPVEEVGPAALLLRAPPLLACCVADAEAGMATGWAAPEAEEAGEGEPVGPVVIAIAAARVSSNGTF